MKKLFALIAALLLCSGVTAKTQIRVAADARTSVTASTTQEAARRTRPSLRACRSSRANSSFHCRGRAALVRCWALVKVADMTRTGAPWSVITTAAPLERSADAGQARCTGLVAPDEFAGVLRPSANVLAWAELESARGTRSEYVALRNNCSGDICTLVATELPNHPGANEPIAPSPNQHAGVIGESIRIHR